jgi:hypothetical protein
VATSSAGASDITLTVDNNANSDITMTAHGSAVILNSTSNTAISTNFTDETIVGAINELEARVKKAAGNPEGSVTGNEGDIFIDTTNDLAYIKTNGTGNTGWSLAG